ncbi:hypothetical protein [Pontibacter rugosus]
MIITKNRSAKCVGAHLLCLLLLGGSAPAALAQGGQDVNVGYQRPQKP